MDTFGTRLNHGLRERIEKMIEEKLAHIIDKRCTSYEDYLGKCEAVQALRDVLLSSDQLHKMLLAEATGQMEIESPVVQNDRRTATQRRTTNHPLYKS